MADERIRVGFVGSGGISRMYTDVYAGVVGVVQVVAVGDLVDDLLCTDFVTVMRK